MVTPTEHVTVSLMATLDGLPNYVVQNSFFNSSTDNYQYTVQYLDPAVLISKSINPDYWDWQYNQGDNRHISFGNLITLNSPLAGHTQTLLQDGGTVITGMKNVSFQNLLNLYNDATEAQKARFDKNNNDTESWDLYNKYKREVEEGIIDQKKDQTDSENWCNLFIGLKNKHITQNPVDGQYVNIIGTDKTPDGTYSRRNEIATDAQGNTLLLAQIDVDNNLYLSVYKLNILDRVGNKLAGLNTALTPYWGENYFPTTDKVDTLKRDDVLSFYKDCLNANDFVFDLLKETPDKTFIYQQDDLLKLTGSTQSSFSYQGFGVDWQENIYLANGFGSKSKSDDITKLSNPHIYKIDHDDWNNCTDIDCYKYFMDQSAGIMDNVYPEIENIQVLDVDCLLVAVAKHNYGVGTTFQNNVYRVSWS